MNALLGMFYFGMAAVGYVMVGLGLTTAAVAVLKGYNNLGARG